jgi:hypothetical protein
MTDATIDAYEVAWTKAQRGQPLTADDMMTLYGYKHSAFAVHREEFERFRLKPSNNLYSGAKVYQHFTATEQPEQPESPREFTFGRKTFSKRRP